MKLIHRRASIKQVRDAARRRGVILLSIIVNRGKESLSFVLLWLVISQQKFLSCMAFSVYEVVRVARLSRINFMYYCRRPGFNRTTGTEEIFDFLLDLCRTLDLSSY